MSYSNLIEVPDCGCVSNTKVYGFDDSVKKSKYPMAVDINKVNSNITNTTISLAKSAKGSGHDNWLNGVVVQFDLTFTVKAWTEAERYHFFDFVSSQSTMHRITKFDLDNSYIEYVDGRIVDIMKEKVDKYNSMVEDGNIEEKILERIYLEILYSNPAGFKLTAGMTTNYRQLKTMYSQRKNHRLPEWREFCRWIESLPCSEMITGVKMNE